MPFTDWLAEYQRLLAELTPRQRALLCIRAGVSLEQLQMPAEWEAARILNAMAVITAERTR